MSLHVSQPDPPLRAGITRRFISICTFPLGGCTTVSERRAIFTERSKEARGWKRGADRGPFVLW